MVLFRLVTGGLATFIAANCFAAPNLIQPTEAQSQDAFIYQGIQGPNPPAFNSETFANGAFIGLLSSGTPDSPHATRSYLRFDFTGASLDAGEVATLNLYAVDTTQTGFGASPSTQFPVIADVRRVTSDWTETGVTWPNQPGADAAASGSSAVTGINQWVSIDVTSLVSQWIANSSTNFGLLVSQPNIVRDTNTGQDVVVVYESASGANRPFIQIAAVPEPSVVALATLGTIAVLARRRRVCVNSK